MHRALLDKKTKLVMLPYEKSTKLLKKLKYVFHFVIEYSVNISKLLFIFWWNITLFALKEQFPDKTNSSHIVGITFKDIILWFVVLRQLNDHKATILGFGDYRDDREHQYFSNDL